MNITFDRAIMHIDTKDWVHILIDNSLLIRLPARMFTIIDQEKFINKTTRLKPRQILELLHTELTNELARMALEDGND